MIEFSPAPAALPSGRRVYAIGDIHGCAQQLANLHTAIAEDIRRRPIASAVLVHIGDYVDRGPDTAGVIEMLRKGPPIEGVETVNILGNHEHTMMEAIAGNAPPSPTGCLPVGARRWKAMAWTPTGRASCGVRRSLTATWTSCTTCA